MGRRWTLVLAMVALLQVGMSTANDMAFRWSTFFIDQTFTEGEEATFEFIAVVECAGLGAWFGGVGGAIGGLACGLTGWA